MEAKRAKSAKKAKTLTLFAFFALSALFASLSALQKTYPQRNCGELYLRVHLPNLVKTVQDEIRDEQIEEVLFFEQSAEPACADHGHRLARETFGLHPSRNLTYRAGGAEKKS